MQIIPQKIHSIVYPGVTGIYKKRDYMSDGHTRNVLVIETNFHDQDNSSKTFDSFITDLLLDLKTIKGQAEKRVGPIDRIDIKSF